MSIKHVADFLAAVRSDEELQQLIKVAPDVDTIAKIAQEHHYQFTAKELQAHLGKALDLDLAVLANPGIANRPHLNPR